MRKIMLAFALSMLPFCAALAEEELPGTYKLISSTRTILETGEVKDSYGKQPKGYIMYAAENDQIECANCTQNIVFRYRLVFSSRIVLINKDPKKHLLRLTDD